MAGDENEERGNWTGRLDFLLSCIGFAVGLGNVWRFPYLAYKNGGASFLFPYVIMLFVAGLPLFFLELALGQFSSEGPITVWKLAPAFQGVGYAMVIISAMVGMYYNVIISWAIYYMFVSFVNLDDGVPWKNCDEENWWQTKWCRDEAFPRLEDPKYNETYKETLLWKDLYDRECVQNTFLPSTYDDYKLSTGKSEMFDTFTVKLKEALPSVEKFTDLTYKDVLNKSFGGFVGCKFPWTTPSAEYFDRYVLRIDESPDIGELGDVSVKMCLTLLLAWILIFACLLKGIKTSGKVVYFTATFPYVILVVLLIRGLTLDGYKDGIDFYIIPDWDKLNDGQIWKDAATQIFFSLGTGFGGLLTMASYNKFKNNCYRDALLVSFINCGTSIFAGFAIFSLLGHMAFLTNQSVEDVAASGPSLAFVAYPDGISRLPGSAVWAFLFFFMILTLGLDSQFAFMESVISGISDVFPNTLRRRKALFTFVVCIIGFLLGIPQTTHGGIRVLTLIDSYCAGYNLMVVAFLECVCVAWVYGINNFRSDIKMMIGSRPKIYWMATWLVITPAAILFIIIYSAIDHAPAGYNDVAFPDWAQGLGWLMVAVPLAVIILVAVIQLYRLGYPGCIKPLPEWGPFLPEHKTGRYAAVNLGFQDDGDQALPYIVDNKNGSPPPSYNGNDSKEADARL